MTKKITLFLAFIMLASTWVEAQIGLLRRDSSVVPLTLEIENANGDFENIDWGQPTDFGPDWSDTLVAEMAWIADPGGDTLGCVPTAKDLTGKWAVIRRGECGFSLKAYHAVEAGAVGYLILNDGRAGAANGVFNMLGGDSINRITIPGAFIPRGFGETFTDRLDAGTVVSARMAPVSLWQGSVYHYDYVPQNQILSPFVGPNVNYFNNEAVDSIFTGTLSVEYPDGTTEQLGTTLDTILPGTQEIMIFSDVEIAPDQGPGEYKYTFSSDLPTANTHTTVLTVTEDYWSAVAGDIQARSIALGEQGYADADNTFGLGMTVEVNEDVALGNIQFGICNAEELTVAGNAEIFVEATVVNIDANFDGQPDFLGATSIDDFPNDSKIGFAEYFITGNEICTTNEDDLITIRPLNDDDEPVILEEGGMYMVVALVGSLPPGTNVSPALQAGITNDATNWYGTERYFSRIFQTDNFFTGFLGFSEIASTEPYQSSGPVFRMFTSEITKTNDFLGGQLILSPNPASTVAELRYSLQDLPSEGSIEVYSTSGQVVYSTPFAGNRAGTIQIPVNNLAKGMYNVVVKTDVGQRTLKLQVAK